MPCRRPASEPLSFVPELFARVASRRFMLTTCIPFSFRQPMRSYALRLLVFSSLAPLLRRRANHARC
eukprot:scaffold223239_cov26-Tisochrysis_lutea.AAC.4